RKRFMEKALGFWITAIEHAPFGQGDHTLSGFKIRRAENASANVQSSAQMRFGLRKTTLHPVGTPDGEVDRRECFRLRRQLRLGATGRLNQSVLDGGISLPLRVGRRPARI